MAGHWRYEFVRTPLERPAMGLRDLMTWPARRRRPELAVFRAEARLIHRVLERTVRPDSRCLDIGAHYGSVLSTMLRLAPDGRHAAIEAMPDKARFLRRKFPEVEVFECAVGDRTGPVDFHVNLTRSGFSSMARHGASGDRFRRTTVQGTTLDALLVADGEPERFDVVKIDVEGAEEQVFRGGRRFLTTARPVVVFECQPSGAAAFDRDPVGVFDALDEAGYDVCLLDQFLVDGPAVSRDRFRSGLVAPEAVSNWVARPRP